MPIQIRELVIRTVVGGDAPAPSPHGPDSSGGGAAPSLSPDVLDQLVQECVRQVMLVLARERDR